MFPFIDMHCDTVAYLLSEKRAGRPFSLRENGCHVDLLRLRRGGCMCQSFALFTNLGIMRASGIDSYENVLALSDLLDGELRKNGDLIRPALTGTAIEENFSSGLLSALKTVEELGVTEGDPERLAELYRRGVRKATLTWNYENALGYPNPSAVNPNPTPQTGSVICVDTDEVHGLKARGAAFVEQMEALGMIVDLSHLNDGGIRHVFDIVKKSTPVISSHANARAVTPHPRNLSDENLRRIADHGGVTGINFFHAFLTDEPGCTLSRVSDMIRHVRHIQKIAGIDSIALGSDFDGIDSDLELKGCGDMQLLADALLRDGFTDGEVEKIFFKNALRVYKDVLG